MNEETLIDIRTIIARIHDNNLPTSSGVSKLTSIELAALRDTVSRLNQVITSMTKARETEEASL